MSPYPTVLVSVIAVLIVAGLGVRLGTDANSLAFFVCWMGAPYLCLCGLALSRRKDGFFVFLNTLLSGGVATGIYLSDAMPYFEARAAGGEVMNCGPPIIQLGIPLLQWLHVLLVFLALKCLPEEEKGTRFA